MVNQIQQIAFSDVTGSGVYTPSFEGASAGGVNMPPDASALTVALAGLPLVADTSNLSISQPDSQTLLVEFIGRLANFQWDPLSIDTSGLLASAPTITVIQIQVAQSPVTGVPGANASYSVSLNTQYLSGSIQGGEIMLGVNVYGAASTMTIYAPIDSTAVQNALSAANISDWSCSSVDGTGDFTLAGPQQTYGSNHPFWIDSCNLFDAQGNFASAGDSFTDGLTPVEPVAGQPEIDTIALSDNPTQGTWTLGSTSLNWNAAASDVQTAIDTLFDPGVASVSGTGSWTVTGQSDTPFPVSIAANAVNVSLQGPVTTEVTITQAGDPVPGGSILRSSMILSEVCA